MILILVRHGHLFFIEVAMLSIDYTCDVVYRFVFFQRKLLNCNSVAVNVIFLYPPEMECLPLNICGYIFFCQPKAKKTGGK
jgi:hypothetical protein